MDASIDPGEKVKAELEVEILVLGHEIGPLRRSANLFLAGMVVKYDRFANSVRAGERRGVIAWASYGLQQDPGPSH